MGDRANVVVRQEWTEDEKQAPVYIYTHWGGYDLPLRVRHALAKRWRWGDNQYLTRIIYDAVVAGSEGTETGFGISTMLGDNEHKVIVVDPRTERVAFVKEDDELLPLPDHAWSFEEFIGLGEDEIRKSYQG